MSDYGCHVGIEMLWDFDGEKGLKFFMFLLLERLKGI